MMSSISRAAGTTIPTILVAPALDGLQLSDQSLPRSLQSSWTGEELEKLVHSTSDDYFSSQSELKYSLSSTDGSPMAFTPESTNCSDQHGSLSQSSLWDTTLPRPSEFFAQVSSFLPENMPFNNPMLPFDSLSVLPCSVLSSGSELSSGYISPIEPHSPSRYVRMDELSSAPPPPPSPPLLEPMQRKAKGIKGSKEAVHTPSPRASDAEENSDADLHPDDSSDYVPSRASTYWSPTSLRGASSSSFPARGRSGGRGRGRGQGRGGRGSRLSAAARESSGRPPATMHDFSPVGPLPAPVPVPNLTKKSRGRKVPVVADNSSIGSHDGSQAHSHSSGSVRFGRRRAYVCTVPDCGKRFVRGEHLKRHVRSIHTYEKPHLCPYEGCEKTFSRRDNLNQHLHIHR